MIHYFNIYLIYIILIEKNYLLMISKIRGCGVRGCGVVRGDYIYCCYETMFLAIVTKERVVYITSSHIFQVLFIIISHIFGSTLRTALITEYFIKSLFTTMG